MGIYMSVGGKYARYDSIINKISSKDVTENVGARLIIHVLEQENPKFSRGGPIKFGTELPVEMDAFFYGKSYSDDTRQESTQGKKIAWHFDKAFTKFISDLNPDIDGKKIQGDSPFEEALLNTLYPTTTTRTMTSTKRTKNDTILQRSYTALTSGSYPVSTTYSDSFEPK